MLEKRFVLRNEFIRTNMLAFIRKLDVAGEVIEVIVRPFIEKRTLEQNARLWLLHELASEVTGYTKDEMHEHALCRFFGYTERKVKDPFTGEVLDKRVPLERSSGKDKKKFAKFMESTEAWYLSDFGVWLDQEAA